ncbi:LPS export ABC transporter periplasmic protein LptC [Hyphobacterium sp. HN65]|uniref:LPS export ABC transporter periplasmic protein LptC n=1 Tax=Hyphobacterium lacteum TaxID=3116575 RepID=A0ABU7LSR9_9PROT|nr:LPS export ABC transporter periplasmic protein LptC [Hyphobacterium sp. HN65]MEE2526967.1 LPS export ABC transporter periplasmic protein LptC [Hyphobacterium sp. HN65]
MTATTADMSALQPAHHTAWEPRRATTLTAARRRTRFVRLLRLGLVGLTGLIVALIIAQIVWRSLGTEEQAPVTVGEDARMINPRFTGRDENGTPYVVTADAAIRRRGEDVRLTELESPQLDYDLIAADDEAEGVLARTGLFDADARTLDLNADVRFRTRSGYEFLADHARIFLAEERVVGDSTVEGEGPLGTIRSDAYEILDGGNRVVFTGNVRTHIRNEAGGDGDQP